MNLKKLISLILVIPSLAVLNVHFQTAAAAERHDSDMDNSGWAAAVSGGMLLPVSGSLDMENSSADLLDTGPELTLSVSKRVSSRFSTRISAAAGRMNFTREIYETSSNFSVASLVLSNSYSILRPGKLDIHIKAGAGMYYWRISEAEFFGEARQFEGEDLQKVSIGLQGGLGAELALSRRISITAESNYNYILCRDTFHFGRGFTEQGMININFGLKFYPLLKRER